MVNVQHCLCLGGVTQVTVGRLVRALSVRYVLSWAIVGVIKPKVSANQMKGVRVCSSGMVHMRAPQEMPISTPAP